MSDAAHITIHLECEARDLPGMEAAPDRFIINIQPNVILYGSRDNMRSVAEAIMRALYPVTAAMADAVGEAVQ